MRTELLELWDYSKPELSEERFRTALREASGDETLILKTQIARTYGIRRDFARAREVLAELEPAMGEAGLEAQTFYFLELGRTYASTAHPPESQTLEAREQARVAYMRALELAQQGGLDDLAIDALHMMTMVDTEPEQQVEWNERALRLLEGSTQPGARRWEGSLRNNMGYALHLLGRYDEALEEFEKALRLREQQGKPGEVRIARWMIAWTLRAMGRLEEALRMQLALEEECEGAGEPDPYVFEELEALYRALGDEGKVEEYTKKREK